jgi:tRNA (guanine10-N2)-dimethyltransferase
MVLEAVRGAKVDVRRPEFVLRALKEGENVYVWINFIGKKERWSERFPRRRAFFHPSALTPRVARFMVNLTCSTDLLFDPFVGTGSTLIEAGLIGAYVVGSDIDLRMVKGCKANLEQFKVYGDVLQADARALPFRKVRAVACDLPYGRASSTYGENVSYIMERFLRELKRTLDGRAVVMYPEGVRPIIPEGLKVEEEFKLYVHKSLTRRVSVIGRVD